MPDEKPDKQGKRVASEAARSRPQVYYFDDYREFLNSLFEYLSSQKMNKLTYKKFSDAAGFKSHSTLRDVILGKRNISVNSLPKIAKAFELSNAETQYFTHLAFFNQAKTPDKKEKYLKLLVNSHQFKRIYPKDYARYKYYSSWHYVVVHQLVDTEGFVEDPKWIAQRVSPSITENEAKVALNALKTLGFTEYNKDGKLVQSERFIVNTDVMTKQLTFQFNRNMIHQGVAAMNRLPEGKRSMSSVTIGLPKSSYNDVEQAIHRFRTELIEIAEAAGEAEEVYQVNFQLFPATDSEEK